MDSLRYPSDFRDPGGRDGKSRGGRKWAGAFLIIALLLGLRALLPWFAEAWINHNLKDIAGYRAHVEDVDLHVLHAAYDIEGFRLVKASGSIPVPFFQADRITASAKWRKNLGKPLTADMEVIGPTLTLVHAEDERHSQLGLDLDWPEVFRKLSFLRVGRFHVMDAEIRFRDSKANPHVDIYAKDVDASLDNLVRTGGSHAADFRADGRVMGQSAITMRLRIDPEAERPRFKMDMALDSMALKPMNRALKAYSGMDVESGTLDMTTHATASGGRFHGKVRAQLHDFDMGNQVKEAFDEDKGPVQALKEGVVEGVGNLLEGRTEAKEEAGRNPPEMSFSGRFPDQVQEVWTMSGYMLKESFDKAVKTKGG
ncbi:MAG: hypothetical protein JWP91_3653 [Fibrobacteres bacterium]|nr:hypothetical protein [Fibrobacterota bacterium]